MRSFPRNSQRLLVALLLLSGLPLVPADGLLAAETPPPAAAEPDSAAEGRRYPVQHCWDAFEASEWGKMTDCLQDSLKQQEVALKEAIDQAAAQAGQSMDKQSALSTLEKSNAKWVAYRDSECDRQLAFVAGRNHPDIGELTCKIRQTVQRIADLKFDE